MSRKNHLRYWIAALLIVVGLVEFFLFSRPALGYTICCLLFLAAYCCLWTKESKPQPIDFAFMVVIVALALPYTLFNNNVLRALNAVALLFCWSVLLCRRVAGEWASWSRPIFILEAGFGWILRPFAALVTPWKETFFAKSQGGGEPSQEPEKIAEEKIAGEQDFGQYGQYTQYAHAPAPSASKQETPGKRRRGPVVFQVIIAICILLPTLSILIWLLAQSDPIFARYVHDVLRWISLLKISTAVWHVIVMIVLLPFVLSFIWTIRARRLFFISETNPEAHAVLAERQRFIPGLTAAIVLISINVVYLMYAVVQFVYLFSGFSGTLPGNLTYASYARRGFAELVVVAVINIVVILVATKFTRRQGVTGVIVRVCNFLLITLAGVQLASAFTRLSLYTSAYGLSQMRVFVFTFLGLTAVLFLILFAREISERTPLFKAAVFATLIALIALNYIAPDALVARYNITHFVAGNLQVKTLDLDYLWRDLSVDSSLVVLQHADKISALGSKYSEQIARFKADLVSSRASDSSGYTRGWGYLDSDYLANQSGYSHAEYFLSYRNLDHTSWRNYNYNLWRMKSLAETHFN